MKLPLKDSVCSFKLSIQSILCLFLLCISIKQVAAHGYEQEDFPSQIFQDIVFESDTEVKLDAGWAFYWNQLIDPANFSTNVPNQNIKIKDWTSLADKNNNTYPSFGYATYRLDFVLPKKRPHLSLKLPSAYASSKIWINGELILEVGKVGMTKETTIHRRFTKIIPLPTDRNDFQIVIQVANFYHAKGGFVTSPILAPSTHLQTEKNTRVISDMIYIGSISFIGVFFLLFYLLYWNKDQAVLYFALLCICWSYRALNDSYAPFALISSSVDWTLLTRIEYITLFLGGSAGCLFVANIFTKYVHGLYTKIIKYSFLVFSVLVVVLPSHYFTLLLEPFVFYMILCVGYMIGVVVKSIIINRQQSILALATIVLGLIVFCLHILVFFDGNGRELLYINLGYVVVFLLASMLLMMRFSTSFKELEISKKIAVEQKKEISLQSNQLSNVNLKLQDNLRLLKTHNAELDDFAHIVSHDLKSPLVSVNALVHFIEEDIQTDLDETTRSHFKLLKERVLKIGSLVDALLEYSKIAKGNKQKEVFSLNHLLHEIVGVVNRDQKHTILLPEGDPEIFANKVEMEHVFRNLIENAIKHNSNKKTTITISFSEDAQMYYFELEDNGPGIHMKYHRKIFDMFTRLHTDSDTESIGIGLSIVKKIISENHGKIWLESEEGSGTKIMFTLKIAEHN